MWDTLPFYNVLAPCMAHPTDVPYDHPRCLNVYQDLLRSSLRYRYGFHYEGLDDVPVVTPLKGSIDHNPVSCQVALYLSSLNI